LLITSEAKNSTDESQVRTNPIASLRVLRLSLDLDVAAEAAAAPPVPADHIRLPSP